MQVKLLGLASLAADGLFLEGAMLQHYNNERQLSKLE
jgi:hypothetical protein